MELYRKAIKQGDTALKIPTSKFPLGRQEEASRHHIALKKNLASAKERLKMLGKYFQYLFLYFSTLLVLILNLRVEGCSRS